MSKIPVTGNERFFGENDIIVSKTDLKGRMTYCNKVFLDVAGFKEKDCLGKPHSIIRHPDMPRCVFKFLWDEIQEGREVFAYVINKAINGDHYWVFAHVTPSFGPDGEIIGYHSNRRSPNRDAIDQIIQPFYKQLSDKEAEFRNGKEAMAASSAMLADLLREKGMEYNQLIISLNKH